jgi:hypothetical protein
MPTDPIGKAIRLMRQSQHIRANRNNLVPVYKQGANSPIGPDAEELICHHRFGPVDTNAVTSAPGLQAAMNRSN